MSRPLTTVAESLGLPPVLLRYSRQLYPDGYGQAVDAPLKLVRRAVGSIKAGVLLDLGSGCGYFAVAVARQCPSLAVMGVDAHMPSVEFARDLANQNQVEARCTFVRQDALAWLSGNDQEFDLVAGLSIWGVLGDDRETCALLLGAIKSDGYLLIDKSFGYHQSSETIADLAERYATSLRSTAGVDVVGSSLELAGPSVRSAGVEWDDLRRQLAAEGATAAEMQVARDWAIRQSQVGAQSRKYWSGRQYLLVRSPS